ncbi:MAG: lipid IV(A) 3-deoxy-D-manno-octulosonic acid transferase [Arenicellales bacterium WSBS_2016_MAG_OTU3]
MKWLYNLALYIYTPALIVQLICRGFRNRAYWQRIPERFGFIDTDNNSFGVWVHAVSVGEVNAAMPLIYALLEELPKQRILITTMTPTGSDQVQKWFGDRVQHAYVPYDYPGVVRRFLKQVRPRLVVVMETEIWLNLITACAVNSVPMVYANVRLSEKSCRGYMRFKKLVQPVLEKVTLFLVQSNEDKERVLRLANVANKTLVTGNTKFEIDLPASLREVAQGFRSQLGRDRSILIAGSTHEGEEEQILTVFVALKKERPDLLLVLVPRHPERFDSVVKLVQRYKLNSVKRSTFNGDVDISVDVYIGDTMGELNMMFAAADVAFVGGSLVPIGGHNILEPCGVGVPVVVGPHMYNFVEISNIAFERGSAFSVNDQQALQDVLERLFSNPDMRFEAGQAGIKMVEDNRGALEKTMIELRRLI